jgi:hypothetical protein
VWHPDVKEPLDLPQRDYLVVVDGSAPVGKIKPRRLRFPAIAEVTALVRSLGIVYVNTITPRVEALRKTVSGSEPIVLSIQDTPLAGTFGSAAPRARRQAERDRTELEAGRLQLSDIHARSDAQRKRLEEFTNVLLPLLLPSSGNAPKTLEFYATNPWVRTTLSPLNRATVLALLTHGYVASFEAFRTRLGATDKPFEFPPEARFLRLCRS